VNNSHNLKHTCLVLKVYLYSELHDIHCIYGDLYISIAISIMFLLRGCQGELLMIYCIYIHI